MNKIKAVIFDLDDTLISENQYIKSGYYHISKVLSEKLNLNENELYETLIELFNISPENVFNRILDNHQIDYSIETILQLVEEYRNHLPTINLSSDVLPLLNMLKKKEIKTGIITDGYSNAQRQKLKVIDGISLVDKVIVTDELGRDYWKPHPKSFELMKEALDVNFNEMVYIGDNPGKDFYISNAYPIKTIRIKRENGVYSNDDYLHGVREDVSITSLNEIENLLDL